MAQAELKATAPIAPPEGEHFAFADVDDGIVLTVRSIPKWWQMLPASLLSLVLFACVFELLARPFGTPWPFFLAAIVITAIGLPSFLWVLLDSFLGFEVIRIDGETILLTQRTLLLMRRESLRRREAYNLRVLPEDSRLGPFRFSCYSKAFGRVALIYGEQQIRFGAPLDDEEAMAVCVFLLSCCPDLGPREAGTAGSGVE